LADRLELDRLLGRIIQLPRDDRWQMMARAALRDDLHAVHAQLTAEVLSAGQGTESAESLVDDWMGITPAAADSVQILSGICDDKPDLARVSVGLRIVRSLLRADG
jgi:glutamate dehydrogenase